MFNEAVQENFDVSRELLEEYAEFLEVELAGPNEAQLVEMMKEALTAPMEGT